jgi:hypothetical protein
VPPAFTLAGDVAIVGAHDALGVPLGVYNSM